jgi:hypothetical protein
MLIPNTQPNKISTLWLKTAQNEVEFNTLEYNAIAKRLIDLPLNTNLNAFSQLIDFSSDWVFPHKMIDDVGNNQGYYYNWVFHFPNLSQESITGLYSDVVFFTNDAAECFPTDVVTYTGLPHSIFNFPPAIGRSWNLTSDTNDMTGVVTPKYTFVLSFSSNTSVFYPMDWFKIKAVIKFKNQNLFM